MKTVEGWRRISIGQCVDLINGFAFPSDHFTDEEGMPLIRIRDLNKQTTEVNYRGQYDKRYLVKKGDLLIGMDGDFLTVRWKGDDALLNQRVCKLIAKDRDALVQDFLFYRIIEEILRIHRVTAATTVKHLSSEDILGIQIDLPSKSEQATISEILSTVDRAIEQAEALIAKQQRIKIGLMQDLLTHGIDEHGNLRSEKIHKFKDSPLGRIPVEWEVEQLSAVVELKVGYAFKSSWFCEDGIRLLRGENVGTGIPDWKDVRCLPPEIADKSQEYQLNAGDMIIGMDRTFTKQGFKVSFLGEEDVPCLLVQRVGCFVPMAIPRGFMELLIQSPTYRRELLLQQKGMDIPHLSKGEILSPLVPIPAALDEMNAISNRIGSLRSTERNSTDCLNKLLSLKTALMQDLLTGKKRVSALTSDVEAPL